MALGWQSVEWGLENISSRELAEWEAYESIEGFVGEFRNDYHFARLMALIINMMKQESQSTVQPKDLMVWLDPELEKEIDDNDEIFDAMWDQVHGDDD